MVADFYMGKWLVCPDDCHVFDGKRKLKLEPKAMDLLIMLASADGLLVSRGDLFAHLWKNQIIADYVLNELIASLRKILEHDPHNPQYIVTVPKKGYRLGLPVRLPQDEASAKQKGLTPLTTINVVAGLIIFSVMVYLINMPS